jgi:GTPase SAR1 family protein
MKWLVQFVPKYISTIGVDFGVKTVVVDNQQVMPPLDRHRHKRISFASCYPPALCISRHDIQTRIMAQVKVNFWDLAGGQEYFEVRNEFYRDAQGVRCLSYGS